MLETYREIWRKEPMMRRILVVSLMADIAFGALMPFVNFYLSDELKAPAHITGIAFSCYLVVETLFKAPFGALSDRYGRKVVLLLGLLIAPIATILMGMTDRPLLILFLFPLAGLGFAAFFPTVAAFLADYAPEEQRGGVMGILNLSYLTGLGISAAVGFWLHHHAGTYRYAFFITATLLVLAGVLTAVLFPSVKPDVTSSMKKFRLPKLRPRLPRLPALSRPMLLLASVFALSQFAASMQIPVVVPYAKEVLQLSDMELGLGVALAAGALALASVPLGRLSDDIGRDTAIRLALVSAIVALVVFPFVRHMSALVILGLLIGVAWLLAFPAGLALSSEVVTEQERGAAVGLVYGGQGIGAILGAPFGGFLAEGATLWLRSKAWGFRIPFLAGATAMIVALALTFWLSRELVARPTKVDEDE